MFTGISKRTRRLRRKPFTGSATDWLGLPVATPREFSVWFGDNSSKRPLFKSGSLQQVYADRAAGTTVRRGRVASLCNAGLDRSLLSWQDFSGLGDKPFLDQA
jgi:hypothetical protein